MFIYACENPFLCIHVCMPIHVFKYVPINERKLYAHTFYIVYTYNIQMSLTYTS